MEHKCDGEYEERVADSFSYRGSDAGLDYLTQKIRTILQRRSNLKMAKYLSCYFYP